MSDPGVPQVHQVAHCLGAAGRIVGRDRWNVPGPELAICQDDRHTLLVQRLEQRMVEPGRRNDEPFDLA
jgi:hypothetical protein